jgi:hypothetical protein
MKQQAGCSQRPRSLPGGSMNRANPARSPTRARRTRGHRALVLSRAGPTTKRLVPFVQEGQSDVVYHSVGDAAWQGLFQ